MDFKEIYEKRKQKERKLKIELETGIKTVTIGKDDVDEYDLLIENEDRKYLEKNGIDYNVLPNNQKYVVKNLLKSKNSISKHYDNTENALLMIKTEKIIRVLDYSFIFGSIVLSTLIALYFTIT